MEIICPQCGSINSSQTTFCFACGYDFANIHVCSNCGEKIKENQKFCNKCGAKLQK